MKGKISWLFTGVILAAAIVFFPLESIKADIPTGPTTGFRSTALPDQIESTGGWITNFGGFKISWDISQTGTASHPWSYTYTISDEAGGELARDLSHFILEVSQGATGVDFDFLGATNVVDPTTYNPGDPSNPNLQASIYGIKFDDLSGGVQTFDFLSNREPVWGDFYAKGGNFFSIKSTAWNEAIGIEPNADDAPFDGWIPRPDSSVVVPEPSTLLILGSGMAAALAARRRKLRKK